LFLCFVYCGPFGNLRSTLLHKFIIVAFVVVLVATTTTTTPLKTLGY